MRPGPPRPPVHLLAKHASNFWSGTSSIRGGLRAAAAASPPRAETRRGRHREVQGRTERRTRGARTRLVGKPSWAKQAEARVGQHPHTLASALPRSARALAHSHYYHHAPLRAALRRVYAFTRRFSPYSALGKKRHAARRRYPRPASTHTPPEQPTGRAVETRRRETVLFINLQQRRSDGRRPACLSLGKHGASSTFPSPYF